MPNPKDNKSSQCPPKHVAIIMDGNGRWAKERGKARIQGHRQGARQIEEVIRAARDEGVKYLTLYAFSSENWNRPKAEVDALMSLLASAIKKNAPYFVKNRIRFNTIGYISALPSNCVESIKNLVETTREYDSGVLTLALNYGSRDEITRAIKKLLIKAKDSEVSPEQITWSSIERMLDTAGMPDPDLLIRTSGEMRLSNYLMLQSAYSELYFTKTYWPDFGRDEFHKAVMEYKRRERRYGLTADQLKK